MSSASTSLGAEPHGVGHPPVLHGHVDIDPHQRRLAGIGMSLYVKRLDYGRFIWPSPADGAVRVSAAQLGYLLDGIDWRNPRHTWRPAAAG